MKHDKTPVIPNETPAPSLSCWVALTHDELHALLTAAFAEQGQASSPLIDAIANKLAQGSRQHRGPGFYHVLCEIPQPKEAPMAISIPRSLDWAAHETIRDKIILTLGKNTNPSLVRDICGQLHARLVQFIRVEIRGLARCYTESYLRLSRPFNNPADGPKWRKA